MSSLNHNQLSKLLENVGYYQYSCILPMRKYDHLPISFTLVVDNLSIKYVRYKAG